MKLKKSGFIENLIKINRLREKGFSEWIFYPGMLFNSGGKWWGNSGKRDNPHEGIDLCLFRDKNNRIHGLDIKTEIPVIYDGEVVKVEDDFLGKSIYVRHEIFNKDGGRLYTVYGHTRPRKGISKGKTLKEGEVICTLSGTAGKKLPPHLHVSILWFSKSYPPEKLDWDVMRNPKITTLIDPGRLILLRYALVNLQ